MRPTLHHDWKSLGSFGTLGIEIALYIVLPLFGGRWVDDRYGTAPWFMVVGLVIGLGACIKALMRVSAEATAQAEREDAEEAARRKRYLRQDEDDNDDDDE